MKSNKFFEEYYLKKRDDISFITLKKGAAISFKDKTYITEKEMPVPVRVEKLLEDIKKQNEIDGITLNNIVDGIIYILGSDSSFEHIRDYMDMFEELDFKLIPYIIYCINNSNKTEDSIVYGRALINNEENEKTCFMYASALEKMGMELHDKENSELS